MNSITELLDLEDSDVFTYRVKFSRYKFISKVTNLLTP